ncbi:hypothetical protein D3C78_1260820 [compost metagenome]
MTQFLLGKTGRCVSHALLITPLMHYQITAVLFQRLPQTEYVAVTENRKDAFDEFGFHAVDYQILVIKEPDECLCHG